MDMSDENLTAEAGSFQLRANDAPGPSRSAVIKLREACAER